MRKTLAFLLLLTACDDDWPGIWANGDPFAVCAPPPPVLACGGGRTFALAVCGDLTADNTLDVSGADADVALWVRDEATTRAPLRVDGDYWSESHRASNTQTVRGTTRVSADGPACPSPPEIRWDPAWDVRIDEPAVIDLAGCSFAQPSLEVDNTLDVRIRGDVTWVIERDLHIAAPLTIVVEPGASLRWTIGGALEVDNTLTVGGPSRMTVHGRIHVAAPFALEGSLIAPQSRVEVDNTLGITGAAYVGSLRVAAPMRVEGKTLLREDGCASVE